MFPTFKVSLTGLDPTSKYIVYMDVVPVDNHRYKYHNSQWMITGAAEPHSKSKNWEEIRWKTRLSFEVPGRFYPHPDSNSTGAQLMKQPLSFSKLKLTNNTADQNGHVRIEKTSKIFNRIFLIFRFFFQIVLNSMHKYIPRLHVIQAVQSSTSDSKISMNAFDNVNVFIFPETQFIAVTAYQNENVKKKQDKSFFSFFYEFVYLWFRSQNWKSITIP